MKTRKLQPTAMDIHLYNKLLKGCMDNGTTIQCDHCKNFIKIPQDLRYIGCEELKSILNCKTRQSAYYRLYKGHQFGGIKKISPNSKKIKIRRYHPIPFKKKAEQFNKELNK